MIRLVSLILLLPLIVMAQGEQSEQAHNRRGMTMDDAGAVMNENKDTLPRGCDSISTDHDLEIHTGRKYASDVPGMIFGYDEHDVRVEPCSRVTITLTNEDEVRHQWMVHGLPRYLYPAGMFQIEAMGGHSKTGSFIVPVENKSYLIHCDMAQHMEKGLRGQLVVGSGSGDLWGVNGVSDQFLRDSYLPESIESLTIAAILMGILAALLIRLKS
jgi:FtsP/CotA-like multicopper oxidase with cupredoxin domain